MNTRDTSEIRDLTAADMDEVSGGSIAHGIFLWFLGSVAWDCLKGQCPTLPDIRMAPSHGEFGNKI
jgi:hypothetical protein